MTYDMSEEMDERELASSLNSILAHFQAINSTAPLVLVGKIEQVHALDELEMALYGWKRIEGVDPA